MNRRQLILVLAISLLFLTSCNLFQDQPTPIIIPSPAPTMNMTIPPPLTATPTATSTAQPSPTTRPTETASAIPTETPPPTTSVAPSPTAEPTSTPKPSPTVQATSIPQPTATTAPPGMTIDLFKANVEIADPGDTITLEWVTSNAQTVTLWKLAPTGQFSNFWTVEPTGSFDYTIAENERNWTTFALAVTDAADQTVMSTVQVTLRCPDNWFFPNPPAICPANAPMVSAAAEQHFERGTMIWVAQEDLIYILYADSQQYAWEVYPDEWDPGEPDRDPTINPPAGYYQPVRGFGLVWRDQFRVRERLGWASSQETSYTTRVQRTSYAKYNETFIQALDGNVWRLGPERSSWEKLPG